MTTLFPIGFKILMRNTNNVFIIKKKLLNKWFNLTDKVYEKNIEI